jgi:hypothetical protein
MPRPGVIKPRAPLVRDAVRIDLAARDGEIADEEVTRRARFILSFMSETERVSLSSRGKIEGYDPPVERFGKAAEAFITKFELEDMLASFDEHGLEDEPPPELGGDPSGDSNDSAGSQRESPPGEVDIVGQRPERLLEALSRKRKASPSFQTSRKTSPCPETDHHFAPLSPDSPCDWEGIGDEKDSSEEPSPLLDKGKGKQIIEQPLAAQAAEREELAREREIRANHRVTPSDGIPASALIAALQAERDKTRFVTPPNQNRQVLRSPSSHASTSSNDTYQHRRFSVDELGSPSFRADRPRLDPIPSASIEVELVDAPSSGRSPLDVKIEDAPQTPPPHRIPGAWSPSTHIKFGEFGVDIPVVYRPVADDDIDIPDAPLEENRYKREVQLFDSKGEPPRVSLPPTPIQQKPITVPKVVTEPAQQGQKGYLSRPSFTPKYPPPASYGAWLAPSSQDAAQQNSTSVRRYQSKATQTDTDMTSKKIEALEEIMKQLILANDQMSKANEKRDDTLAAILTRLSTPADATAAPPGDAEKAHREATLRQLEKERAEFDAELKARYEAVGCEYPDRKDSYGQERVDYEHPRREYGQDWRSEHVKVEQVGLIQPLPPHADWTGQIVDNGNSLLYVSFKGWLDHVEAVLSQKETLQWKKAVLDCATLSCLRGRALDWWNALSHDQQLNLRNDFTLMQWRELGRPLFRNASLTRREARDRKRQRGETLSEYAWKKLAMLNEAYGRNRPIMDVIADIKEGMSIADQEKITTDLQKCPTMTRFMEELERLDSIRGPQFKDLMTAAARGTRQGSAESSKKTQYRTDPRKPSLAESYDSKQLAFRQNPLTPSAPKQWSYTFPNGRTIFLSSPCTHCGAKHFNFECDKRTPEPRQARAAISFGGAWDEGDDDDDGSGGEEDFMETACSQYVCIEPSSWAFYGQAKQQPGN